MKQEQKEEDPFEDQKQEINALLKEKDIEIETIKIKQFPSGRYQVEIYHKLCDEIEGTKCEIKKIGRILNKVLDNIPTENDEISNMIIDISNNLKNANRQQKLQTDTILNHMTDGVVAFDIKGNITYINPVAKKMLELGEKDNIGFVNLNRS